MKVALTRTEIAQKHSQPLPRRYERRWDEVCRYDVQKLLPEGDLPGDCVNEEQPLSMAARLCHPSVGA
jgi:hypothetical protein